MKKSTLFITAVLISGYCYGQKKLVNNNVDKYIKQEMKETGAPGMAVAVIKNGKILHCNTYGIANIEYNQPVTVHTAFQIASVTKLFTSTLVMKWIQNHRITLNDYVKQYIPDAPPSWKDIQIKHLLAHEGGIPWPASLGGYIGTGSSAGFKVEPTDVLIKT